MAADLLALDPDLAQGARELLQACAAARLQATITSTLRTLREQTFLYNRYVAGKSPLPAAPPGHSAHEYGWAFDMVVSPREYQRDVGLAWEEYWGGVWGGHKKDPVHFELPGASQQAWQIGESQGQRAAPAVGDAFYKLADFLSGFVPGLGELQLVDTLVGALDGNNDLASWYLQHPAEAIRDIGSYLRSKF